MQIKDVEKLTSLPAKTIRYYEDKKLLEVDRNPENDYRDYSESNVRQLRKIKIFRYLGFPIKEIQDILSMDNANAKELIKEKAETFNNQIEDFENKRRLAWKLHDTYDEKDYVENLDDHIDFLEGPELEELENLVGPEKIYSVWSTLGFSLAFMLLASPIVIGHLIQDYSKFFLKLVAFSVGILAIVSLWKSYFKNLKKHRADLLEKNRREWVLIPIFLGFLIAITTIVSGFSSLQSALLLPKNWLFFEGHKKLYSYLEILVVLGAINLLENIIKYVKKERTSIVPEGNTKYYSIGWLIFLLAVYMLAMNFTSVSKDGIRIHRPWKPLGQLYSFNQVESINTGFDKDGDFFYVVNLGGHESKFDFPTINRSIERYRNNTYLEIEELDQKLVKLGINKNASEENSDKSILDQEYVDRFLRIIKNLPN